MPEINQDGDAPMEHTTSVDGAVMVSCIEEDGKVIVRPMSIGYNSRKIYLFSYSKYTIPVTIQ